MPAFAYQAVDTAGRKTSGIVEAGTPEAARRSLRERRLLPVTLDALSEKGARGAAQVKRQSDNGSLPLRGLAVATRQLATLVDSDVRVDEALRIVAGQTELKRVGKMFWTVRASVIDGRSLSGAMAGPSGAFPVFYLASVAAGEQSGKLGEVLIQLADRLESRRAAQQKIQLALLYPGLLAAVSLTMVTLLLIYVVPDIVRVFVARGVELPWLTRALIALSGFVSRWGLAMVVVLTASAWLVRSALRSLERRLAFDRWLASAPLIGNFVRQVDAARFSGTLATLVSSGVPLLDAMRASSASVTNRYIRSKIDAAAVTITEGGVLSTALERSGCFPPMLYAMIQSGERSGKLAPALERASRDLDQDVSALITASMALIEPGVLLLMGGVVLTLVLAILLPIVNLNNLAGM